MALPLLPIAAAGAAFLLFRRKGPKPPSGIAIFEGQGEHAPDLIEVVAGEEFAVRFWAPEVQEWVYEGGSTSVIKPVRRSFEKTPQNGLIPSVFSFIAKHPGEVRLDFALQSKDTAAAGPRPMGVSIRARVK